jgi:hypothetical protein
LSHLNIILIFTFERINLLFAFEFMKKIIRDVTIAAIMAMAASIEIRIH